MDDPIHEPRCPVCKRFDANCNCDWPMPSSAPTTPPDDEELLAPAAGDELRAAFATVADRLEPELAERLKGMIDQDFPEASDGS
jgi:hypothetical protein